MQLQRTTVEGYHTDDGKSPILQHVDDVVKVNSRRLIMYAHTASWCQTHFVNASVLTASPIHSLYTLHYALFIDKKHRN